MHILRLVEADEEADFFIYKTLHIGAQRPHELSMLVHLPIIGFRLAGEVVRHLPTMNTSSRDPSYIPYLANAIWL